MTLLEIEILAHYYSRAGDYRDGDFSAPAVREAIDRFREDAGLLRYTTDEEQKLMYAAARSTYSVTDRGRRYIEVLQSVPLPIQIWVMPDPWPQPSR